MEFFAKTFDELTTKELYEILKSRSQIFTIEQNIHCQDCFTKKGWLQRWKERHIPVLHHFQVSV